MDILGQRLKELRKLNHLTQEFISDYLKINRVTYHGYEANKHLPVIESLVEIADYYKVSLDYLCGRYKQ